MPRKDRAKQFAPFDALKGLQDALRLKEYEHERIERGDLTEEQVEKISKTLREIEKNDMVEATFFEDGYYKTIQGKAKIDIVENTIKIGEKTIKFDDLKNIKKSEKN